LFDSDPQRATRPRHHTWFRGQDTRHAPNQAKLATSLGVPTHVLHGWLPDQPRIDHTTRVTAFGSCFAAHISGWLARRNYRVAATDPDAQNTYVVQIGEGMVNSFVIRQQFEWAWEDRRFETPLWYGNDHVARDYDEEVRLRTKNLFDQTDVFILTFGLSEVWYDRDTGEVFWRALPRAVFDPERHVFRVSTVEENRANIRAIVELIRRHRPGATIITTLSPIPLIATFRDVGCLTANSASKAILRVAIDEELRHESGSGDLFYWPAYEIVTDALRAPFKADRRHLPRAVRDYVMIEFEHHWCHTTSDGVPSRLEAWIRARAASGLMPHRLEGIIRRRDVAKLEAFAARTNLDRDPAMQDTNADLLRALVDEWRTAS